MTAASRFLLCLLFITISFSMLAPSAESTLGESAKRWSEQSLIVLPDASAQTFLTLIQKARKSISIAIPRLDAPKVINALELASARGVKIKILLDKSAFPNQAAGTQAFKELERRGMAVAWSPSSFSRMSQKTAIIDGSNAWIMTFDLTEDALNGQRGFATRIQDPLEVKEIEAMFAADWAHTRMDHESPKLIWSPNDARSKIIEALHEAKHTIELWSTEVTDREIISTLGNVIKSGITVRALLGASSGSGHRSQAIALTQQGVFVRVPTPPDGAAGVILIDAGHEGAKALMGSLEYTEGLLDATRGLDACITDAGRIKILHAIFWRDWKNAATPR